MDKNAIKKYAVWARQELLRRVAARAEGYGVSKDECLPASADAVRGRLLTPAEKTQRQKLLAVVRKNGYEQVIEEAAYTWFNRLIALRFLEVNGYLPSHVRVFTNEAGGFQPQILAEALHLELPGLDQDRVIALKQANDEDGLYKYLLIIQCNALSAILPGMFQKIEDYTELLFPDHVLRNGSVIERMVHDIPESDWKEQVQIIGWLYQYYNTEPKDQVFADLKKNIKITKEKIPAATQLFTPDWIVRYMVENSLGRIFINGQLSGMGDGLSEPERIEQEKQLAERMGWRYYLPEAEQTPEVRAQLRALAAPGAPQTAARCPLPTLIDPCMGSGHILAYAFDLLMQLYLAYGYTPRDAVRCILLNNLYGLDIDERAAQLAYFSVMMKAVQYDPRILRRSSIPQPHVFAIAQSNGIDRELLEYFANGDAGLQRDIETVMEQLQDAKEYGSLLTVSPADFGALYARFDQIIDEVSIHKRPALEELLPVVQTAELLAGQYDVVCTNPPYMAVSNASPKTQTYAKNYFPDAKSDLFACFILRCGQLARQNGYQAMITQHAWMFLSSYEKLRARLQAVDTINMAHLGARAFDEIGGEVVQTTSFVMRQSHTAGYKGTYCRLVEPNTQQGKEELFLAGENRYITEQDNFSKIPGAPVAYWVSEKIYYVFANGTLLENIAHPKKGLATTDNNRFLRFWSEVCFDKVGINYLSASNAKKSNKKWFPLNKGGEFRRWYGNKEYLINWENDGHEIKSAIVQRYNGGTYTKEIRSEKMYFSDSITWSALTAGASSFRFSDYGALFDSAGSSMFPGDLWKYLLAFLNTKIADTILSIINPTLNYGAGSIGNLPIVCENKQKSRIESIIEQCVNISKIDWDFFEVSWDFRRHPLVCKTKREMEFLWDKYAELDNSYYNINIRDSDLFKDEFQKKDCFYFIERHFKEGGKEEALYLSFEDSYKREGKHQHTVSLYLLGLLLQNILNSELKCKINELIVSNSDDEKKSWYDYRYTWFLTCLYHDIASCTEAKSEAALTEENKKIANYFSGDTKIIYSPYEHKAIKDNVSLVRFQKNTVSSYFRYREDAERSDHGIVGGLILFDKLYQNFNDITKDDDWEKQKIYWHCNGRGCSLIYRREHIDHFAYIADAIICHNIWMSYDDNSNKKYREYGLEELIIKNDKKTDNRLNFEDHPLQFILCLLDTIEPVKRFHKMKAIDVLKNISIVDDFMENQIPPKRTLHISWTQKIKDQLDFETWIKSIQELPKWMDVEISPCKCLNGERGLCSVKITF